MKKNFHTLKAFLTIIVTAAVFLAGQPSWAQIAFTIKEDEYDNNQFLIHRVNSFTTQTVHYRAVGVSAVPGMHFYSSSGTLTFQAGETSQRVTVKQRQLYDYDMFYQYQAGNTRSFRLELLDQTEEHVLASYIKEYSYEDDYKLQNKYVSQEIIDLIYFDNSGNFASALAEDKYFDRMPAGITETLVDDGDDYGVEKPSDTEKYEWIQTTVFFQLMQLHNVQKYFEAIGNKLYAAIGFTMKEVNDGFQYIQILTHNGTPDGKDPNGSVKPPEKSIYKACFILSYEPSGSVMKDYHKQFFPHRYDYHNTTEETQNNISHHEFDYDNSRLYQQAFYTSDSWNYRAAKAGAFILPPTIEGLYLRFDANGQGPDSWYYKDVFMRMTVCDDASPILIDDPIVSISNHYKGTPETISIPFNEVVTVTGKPTLTTSWGTFSYDGGSGSNVLSFSGNITADPGTQLIITKLDGTVTDLIGNAFTWTGTKTVSCYVTERVAEESLNVDVTATELFNGPTYMATFYNGKASYKLPAGALAYTARLSETNDRHLVFYRIGEKSNIIPRGMAVIIMADGSCVTKSRITLTKTTETVSLTDTYIKSNILRGSDSAIPVTDNLIEGKRPYILSRKTDLGLWFYPFAGQYIPGGKAYFLR